MVHQLRKIDHVTCAVRRDTIERWAWFYIEILGGTLTLRTDDTNPGGPSSMMVWTIEFAEFGVALIAGIDRTEKSHVSAFVEKHGDHCFQHVAFLVPDLEPFCSRLAAYGVSFLGDTLAREDPTGRAIKQVFGSPFHDEDNSSLVSFYEFVERPPPSGSGNGSEDEAPAISFSERAGTLLYEQAQRAMADDARARLTRFSRMPPDWQVPAPRIDPARDKPVSIVKRPGRREHDAEPIADIQRWHSYRAANARYPNARDAELGEMLRLLAPRPGETIAEIGAGRGGLTYPLATAIGPSGRVFTYDVSRDNLVSVMLANDRGLPIIAVPLDERRAVAFPNVGEVDAVASIATLHHFDDRSVRLGTSGRQDALAGVRRMLRSGGRLVIGDVAANTAPQRYFDAIDDPRYCYPNGHPHDFLTGPELAEMCRAAGFVDITYEVRSVPWAFASSDDATDFIATMHNAQCSLAEIREIVEQHLGFIERDGRCLLQWELLFVRAHAP